MTKPPRIMYLYRTVGYDTYSAKRVERNKYHSQLLPTRSIHMVRKPRTIVRNVLGYRTTRPIARPRVFCGCKNFSYAEKFFAAHFQRDTAYLLAPSPFFLFYGTASLSFSFFIPDWSACCPAIICDITAEDSGTTIPIVSASVLCTDFGFTRMPY